MIRYDLYSAVSTICAKRSSCSGVSAESGAFGRAKSSSTVASDSGGSKMGLARRGDADDLEGGVEFGPTV